MDLGLAVTAGFSVLKPDMGLERLGVATQGTPGSTHHQPDDFHEADKGRMDNTLVGGSGKYR